MIEGVKLKQLVTHTDERGYFRELIRKDDILQFGQLPISMMKTGVKKYGHIHQIQTDYWHILGGMVKVQLNDMREWSSTFGEVTQFEFGDDFDPAVLTIPPGVAHGLKVFEGPSYLIYITTHTYNVNDEGRIELEYNWDSDYYPVADQLTNSTYILFGFAL